MKKNILAAAGIMAAIIASATLASCDSKDNKLTQQYPFQMINMATVGTDTTWSVGQALFLIDYLDPEESAITFSNLLLPTTGTSTTLSVSSLKTALGEGNSSFVFTTSQATTAPVSGFTASIAGDYMNPFYSFTTSGIHITGFGQTTGYRSRTDVAIPADPSTPIADRSTASNDANLYYIVINELNINSSSRTIQLRIGYPSFEAGNVTEVDFLKLPFSMNPDGTFSASLAELVPHTPKSATEFKEMTGYKVKDLNINGRFGSSAQVTFTWSNPASDRAEAATVLVNSELLLTLPQDLKPAE